MSYYDEEFYNEPSEFEQQVDEFKQTLLNGVKEDFVNEMDRLKKENAELQEIKNNFEKIKKDYRNKEHQLEMERNDLARKIRSERLSVLMKDFEVLMFKADYESVLGPKCGKCDDGRKVHFKTPSGKDTHEMCDCSKRKNVYFPAEFVCSEFRIDRDNNNMLMWYKMNPDRDYDHASFSSSDLAKTKYEDGMKYEELKSYYSTYFSSQEECQKYCDWLNARSAIESTEPTQAV